MRDPDEVFREGVRAMREMAPAEMRAPEDLLVKARILGRTEALERATGRFQLVYAALYGLAAAVVGIQAAALLLS